MSKTKLDLEDIPEEHKLIIKVFKSYLKSIKNENQPFVVKLFLEGVEVEEMTSTLFYNFNIGYKFGNWGKDTSDDRSDKIKKLVEDIFKFNGFAEFLPKTTELKVYCLYSLNHV